MTSPRSLILGFSPPKCGTTSLFHELVKTNEIVKPIIKEPRFFAFDENLLYQQLPSGLELNGSYNNGINWFQSLFAGTGRFHIDFTTAYSIIEEAPELAVLHYPDTYGICVLRSPVDRFISHYFQYTKVGIDMPSLEEIIYSDSDVSKFMFSFSDYTHLIERFEHVLGPDRVLVLDFRDLKDNRLEIQQSINAFLGIDDFVYDPAASALNVAGVPKSKLVARLLFNRKVRSLMSSLSPEIKVKLLAMRKRVILKNTRDAKYPDLTPELTGVLEERLANSIECYNQRFGSKVNRR